MQSALWELLMPNMFTTISSEFSGYCRLARGSKVKLYTPPLVVVKAKALIDRERYLGEHRVTLGTRNNISRSSPDR